MGERGPAGPDEQTVLKAWEASVRGDNLPTIAERLGISVSTARRYVRQGRELALELEYGEDGELALAAERERAAATMQMVKGWMSDYVDAGGDAIQAALVVIKAEERRAKALGTDAAQRVSLEDGRRPAARPAPFVVDAVEEYRRGRARGEIER